MGLRIGPTDAEIAGAKAGGISDLVLDLSLPGDWAGALARAEAAGMRYIVAVSSLAPLARGWTVEPSGYRIAGITRSTKLELNLPGATSAFTVLLTSTGSKIERAASIERTERVRVQDGKLIMEVRPGNDLEHELLIYPEGKSLSQTDFWEGFDEHRDRLLVALKNAKPGPGFRGLLNPLGAVLNLGSSQFVPSGPYFRAELREYLEKRYKSPKTLQDAWMIVTTDLSKFEDFARLVPLWSGGRGVYAVWDPSTDKLYSVESRGSAAWTDIKAVVNAAAARRFQRLVRSIKLVSDVPVTQEWSGWIAPYETSTPSVDGLGMKVSGTTPSAIAASASRVTSSIQRWRSRGWLLATDVELGQIGDPASQLGNVLDDLASLGARAWFFRPAASFGAAIAAEAARRSSDASLAEWSPKGVYFPENATNPAVPQRLAGGRWWLPSPAAGNRIDLGTKFFAYRLQDADDQYLAIWGSGPAARVKLLTPNPKLLTVTSTDGSDPKPAIVKGGVIVTLGEYPLIVRGAGDVPIPEPALAEAIFRFEHLLSVAASSGRDTTEEAFYFREAMAGFERNPSGGYAALRGYFWRLNARLGGFTWIEAESASKTNFSEVTIEPGSSAAALLTLKTSLTGAGLGAYFSEWKATVRQEGQMEVWVAARLPDGARPGIRFTIGGESFQVKGDGVSRYGAGMAWYRLGMITAKPGPVEIRMDVDAPLGADLAVDAILLHPGTFVPNGITPPDSVTFPVTRGK